MALIKPDKKVGRRAVTAELDRIFGPVTGWDDAIVNLAYQLKHEVSARGLYIVATLLAQIEGRRR